MAFGGRAVYHVDPNAQSPRYANLLRRFRVLVSMAWMVTWLNLVRTLMRMRRPVQSLTYIIFSTDYLGRDLLRGLCMGPGSHLKLRWLLLWLTWRLGSDSGYSPVGKVGVDLFMQRVIEILSSIPQLVIMVLMATAFTKTGMAHHCGHRDHWLDHDGPADSGTDLAIEEPRFYFGCADTGWITRQDCLETLVTKPFKCHYYSNDVHDSKCDLLRSVLELYRDWDQFTTSFIGDVDLWWAEELPILAISDVVPSHRADHLDARL